MVPPTTPHRIDCVLTGRSPAACLFYDWTAVHSSVCPSLTLSSLWQRAHAVWMWETAQRKRGTLDIIKPKTPLSLQACLFFLSPAHYLMSRSVFHFLLSWRLVHIIKNVACCNSFKSSVPLMKQYWKHTACLNSPFTNTIKCFRIIANNSVNKDWLNQPTDIHDCALMLRM